MSIPMQLFQSNPKANYTAHKSEIDSAIARVLDSGRYILGEEVAAFEKEFADYLGISFGIGVGSGTEALHLALRACDIEKGDEVITVSHTAVATVAAIELCGAIPVLIDVDINTYTMDHSQIEAMVTDQTKAIIPVHMYGHPAEMDVIMSIANRYKLSVIEDCAQSHGACYKGRMTGTWGHISAFSFYPTKNLGAIGDGGMVVTNDPGLSEKVRLLREYGWRQRYISDVPGFNSRLDELQAAILRVKLNHLDEEIQKRQELAKIYQRMFSTTNLVIPIYVQGAEHVFHQYVIRSRDRDSLKDFLKEKGIATLIHYPVPIHCQPAYQQRLRIGPMVNTETIVREILSLPIYPELSFEQVEHIANAVISWKHRKRV